MTNDTLYQADIIGGFDVVEPNCKGCGKPLTAENAWMTDGCPCNHPLGINNLNETRWRLLMGLQQRQSHELERLRFCVQAIRKGLCDAHGALRETDGATRP